VRDTVFAVHPPRMAAPPPFAETALRQLPARNHHGPAKPGRIAGGYSGSVFDVTDDTFERDVLQADVPVVLDFWAPWCGPCRAVEPILQQLEEEARGRVEFARINIDEHPLTASRYDVLSIPTAILFDGGEAKATLIGARPRSHYERALAEVLPTA
jgi:thioredoxin 1